MTKSTGIGLIILMIIMIILIIAGMLVFPITLILAIKYMNWHYLIWNLIPIGVNFIIAIFGAIIREKFNSL